MKTYRCRYRDFFGRWSIAFIPAIDADSARVLCSQRHGHCAQASEM